MKALNICLSLLFVASSAFAESNGGRGGGDSFTLDFISVAQRQLFPWLAKNGEQLNPSVDAVQFIAALDVKKIVSIDHVFESCDGTNKGREVEACFDNVSGNIFLSRTRYPIAAPEADRAKLSLVAHEIFRKMGLEGDDYRVSTQVLSLMTPVASSNIPVQYQEIKVYSGAHLLVVARDTHEVRSVGRINRIELHTTYMQFFTDYGRCLVHYATIPSVDSADSYIGYAKDYRYTIECQTTKGDGTTPTDRIFHTLEPKYRSSNN